MIFDSNRAWQEASAAVRASRSLVMPVAGVFFLVPNVATSFFLGDIQARMLASMRDPEALTAIIEADGAKLIAITLAGFLAGLIGYLACLVLLTDASRPTVGEAIARAFRLLPALIGATIIGYLAMIFLAAIISILGGLLSVVLGSAGAVFMLFALIAGLGMLAARLSLTMPVIVVENQLNPVSALMRSWALTKGNGPRIFGFYALLFIAYLVVAVILMVIIGIFTGLATGSGSTSEATLIVTGLFAGALGAVVAVLVSAVIAAIHRQLAGLARYSIDDTFG